MSSYKVLVVEPSNVYQLVLQQFLEEHECQPLFAKTGKEACELAEYSTFDLICVAMELRDMSGTDLCRKIRSLEGYTQSVPVVMITTNENHSVLESALRAGANEIFHKSSLIKFSTFLTNRAFTKEFESQVSGSVLYVEDSRSQAAAVIASMEKQGHEVTHVTCGDTALKNFAENEYDLVLTDIFLEGSLTGLDIVKTIRSDDENRKTPILAMSAADDPKQKIELLRNGANDYIAKPIIQEELVVRAQNLITTKKLLDELEKQQQHFKEMAIKDQLTGLFNRHFLMEIGPKSIKEAHRHQHELSMFVVDLDHFKLINDNQGHATGDIVLENIGSLLLNSCRDEDMACRFGGEEFVLLLPHCGLGDAELKAESLRKTIEQAKPAGLTVTASIGVSSLFLDVGEDDIASLFSRADAGTYIAKDNGRNQVVLVTENAVED
jgi:two-component system cell cycle response regulator